MDNVEGPSKFRMHHVSILRDLRVKAGLSQPALADMVKRHRTWVSKAESGSTNLSIDTVDLLRTALLKGERNKAPLRARVGRKIALARAQTVPPMSQEALSIIAGCNIKYVSQVELAHVGTRLDQLAKLVDFLRIDYDEIFD